MTLKESPLYWLVLRQFARLVPLAYFKKPPTIIIVDVTNLCNLRCPVCPVTIAMTRNRGLMKLDLFKIIIDDFKDHKKKPSIYFNFSGEPTLNKALPDLVEYASRNGHDTFLSTNATKLDDKMAERLISAGLARVNLCMDGFSKEAQESYRIGSDYDAVKANIETFLDIRRRMGADNPFCVLQTLLTAYSEEQIEDLTDWARDAGFDRVRFKTFSVGSYTTNEEKQKHGKFLPTSKELRRHPTGIERSICMTPIHQSVVFWDGDVGLCCIDYDQLVPLPNIREHGFLAAFTSPQALKVRKKGFLKGFDLCKGCSYGNAESMGFKIDLRPS